jgi:hypothetical protein
MIRILKCAFLMPLSRLIIASFVVFGSRTVGVRRPFVMFGGFPVRFVHSDLSSGSVVSSPVARDPPIVVQFARLNARLIVRSILPVFKSFGGDGP